MPDSCQGGFYLQRALLTPRVPAIHQQVRVDPRQMPKLRIEGKIN